MSEELSGILNVLAERFGTTIEHLWEIMVRQAIISSISQIAFFLIAAILSGLAVKFCWSKSDGDDGWMGIAILFGVFFAAMISSFLITMPDNLTGLLNPEYWALQQVLTALR